MISCSRKNMGVSIGDFLLVTQFSEPSGSYLLRSLIVEFPKKGHGHFNMPPQQNSRDIDLRELAIGFNKNWMFQWMIF